MELEDFYNNAKCKNIKDTNRPQRHCSYEGKARSCRGSRCLLPITVCLGIICLLLIAAIILQHFQTTSKRGYLWGPDGLFMSNEEKSWADSRQYCKDRGADLVIINSEEKQRHISSFIKDKVWIGLSDTQNKGNMKWVDNSPLNQGFWAEGGSGCLVSITVSLGLICVLLLVFIILQHITITAERDLIKSYKNTAEEFNKTINSLQNNYTDLMTEKHQLQNNFSSLSQRKLELETRVTSLREELKKEASKQRWFFMSKEEKSWSDSRQYCRSRGGDLIIINSEEKQHITITAERDLIKSYKNTVEEFNQTINSLQDNYTDLMTEKHQLQNNFTSQSQKNLEIRVNLTAEKDHLQKSFDTLNKKKLELESKVSSLSKELKKESAKRDLIPSVKKYCKTREQKMELEVFYNNTKWEHFKNINGPRRHCSYEGKARSCRGNRCLVPVTVCLGIICLLLIAAIILQHFQATSKQGYLWGPDGLFVSDELKSWSDSRQYCKDRGADLVIINSEEKQRLISPRIKESVWIGLSDKEIKGSMKWVDNSPLKQVFWAEGLVTNEKRVSSARKNKKLTSGYTPTFSCFSPLE
ncbi:hypothetical protein QQF64_000053 [Cirrhinus molitorella]|uniref:C-type lectin domain-containing protein n=1 Tax=Cirrhinus molitorella TaxID=172907 RepID=A0ABR3NW28_9TELE